MTEHEIVKVSLAEIFNKNGYLELTQLTQRDFDHISEKIEVSTGILISGSTIKRLLNGKFSRLPQVATLNAVSKYLGYQNWQEYKSYILKTEEPLAEDKSAHFETKISSESFVSSWNPKVVTVICLAIGTLLIVGFIEFSKTIPYLDADSASFAATKNTNNDIPNTVVFTYNIDQVNADSFFIQQSWDRNRRVRIYKGKHTLTDIYYEPGYHLAKLIANDSVIKVVEINIPTDRWLFFAKDIKPGSNPQYISPDMAVTDGMFGVQKADLLKNNIDIENEKEYIYNFSPTRLEVNSDNFVLKTRVRMREVKNNFCPYIIVDVFCQRYTMFLKATTEGCASESILQFGEKFISGKETDLAALAFDVTQWTDIELVANNKRVTILVNGKESFSTTYKHSSRLLTGLGFISNGLCEIDFVELKGFDGTVFYENNFDSPGSVQ
jgi:hypothetical protein